MHYLDIYTYIKSFETGMTDTTIKGYEKFYSVLLAVAVFVFIKQIPWDNLLSIKNKKLIPTIASCSFGVYLIHMIVVYYEHLYLPLAENLWLWRTVGIFITYIFSLGIVMILGRIPILKRCVGK